MCPMILSKFKQDKKMQRGAAYYKKNVSHASQ